MAGNSLNLPNSVLGKGVPVKDIDMMQRIIKFSNEWKIVRGMISYAVLWPIGSLIEQSVVERKTFVNYDWKKCLRFSLFGGLFVGPTIYLWIRLATIMWPRTDIKSSLAKAITEQLSYDPMGISAFLFGMSLFEGRSYEEAKHELQSKFFDAYRVGVIYWPTVQTINFAFVPQRNQVVVTSFFSMIWTAFLAYMKHLEMDKVDINHHLIDTHFIDY